MQFLLKYNNYNITCNAIAHCTPYFRCIWEGGGDKLHRIYAYIIAALKLTGGGGEVAFTYNIYS